MKSTISNKNISIIFLAIILVAGTIATISPSFLVGTAQAVPYQDMDRENKADKKSVSVSSLKCNNINVNVNGLELDVFPPFLGGGDSQAPEAVDDNIGASSFSDNGGANDGSQIKDFRFICINNNNNTVVASEEPIPLTLMTYNLYVGANLSTIFNPNIPFFQAVGEFYQSIQDTNFVERANSIADEIQETRPDLIGLEEASLIRTQTPSDFPNPQTPATEVQFDYLRILIDALADRGLIYEPIAVQTGSDLEAPASIPPQPLPSFDLRVTDRNVILAREDKDFTLSNIQGAQFDAKVPVPLPTPPFPPGTIINIPSSWVSVDVTFDKGDKARIVSAHLTPLSPIIQGLQADELLNGPGNTNLPVVFIGDFNSKADGTGTPTYSKLLDAGFNDAWTIKGKGNGFTCCQDADLMNAVSSLDERIDLILFRGDFKVKDIELVGNLQNDRTISGLWPSDHAGVVASLKLNSDKK